MGFDVETFEGAVRLFGCSDHTFVEPSETDYTDRLLEWLYQKALPSRTGYNVFYNVGFDLACILKPWIVKHQAKLREGFYQKNSLRRKIESLEAASQQRDLTDAEKAELGEALHDFDLVETVERFSTDKFRVAYVKEKGFSIRPLKNGKPHPTLRNRYFFDAANFYSSLDTGFLTLDAAAQKYLGDKKSAEELGIDRARLGSELGYYEQHRDAVIKYCLKDADLTARLFAKTIEGYRNIGIEFPPKPFSKATIHKHYLKTHHVVDKSNVAYEELNLSAWAGYWRGAYHGGVFLTRAVGNFPSVYDIDIVSAYPRMMADLPSVETARLVERGDPDFDKCYYKFFKIRLKSTPRIQIKTELRIFYGFTEFPVVCYVTDLDLKILDTYGDLYDVIDGIGLMVDESNLPFSYILDFFKRKGEIKVEFGKDSVEYSNIKIFLNGGYGVLAQRRPVESRFTNYIYASYITAYCRWRIWQMIREIENDGDLVLSINTDGLIVQDRTDGEVRERFRARASEELGGIELTDFDDVTLFESGVYALTPVGPATRPCRCGSRHREILKKRGMPSLCVRVLQECKETHIKLEHQKPVKLLQAIIQEKAEWIGTFVPRPVELFPVRAAAAAYADVPTEMFDTPLCDYFRNSWVLQFRRLADDPQEFK